MSATEICGNCGRPIGQLETPRVFGDRVVCAACAKQLSTDMPDAPAVRPRSKIRGLAQLLAVLAVLAGAAIIFYSRQSNESDLLLIGSALALIGFTFFVILRFLSRRSRR